jgi:para-aminobenzoate synthetase component 1
MAGSSRSPSARFGRWLATDLVEVVDLAADPGRLDGAGWWAVAATFEGAITGYRFATVRGSGDAGPAAPARWTGPTADAWSTSLDRAGYEAGVTRIREHIAAGSVYQVNLCRMLSAPLPPGADPAALAAVLRVGNPAPYAGMLDTGDDWIVSASPELFLRRDGDRILSSPIKGTAPTADTFAHKDSAENIMITDLVRNDLGRIARPGTVVVTELLATQHHPGLAHLVSTVQADLRPGTGWGEVFAATFPPGSVSGAPKIRSLQVISELEPVPRGVYCGAFGFVDADRRTARLAVGIRTFAGSAGRIVFGTGAGITWASDPAAEWAETELKADRLIGLASA